MPINTGYKFASPAGNWEDYIIPTKDEVLGDFYKNAQNLQMTGAPVLTSNGPNSSPFYAVPTAAGTKYFIPAFGKDNGGPSGPYMGPNGVSDSPATVFNIDPSYWMNSSNGNYWINNTRGMPVVKAPEFADLLQGTPYASGASEYTGGGWLSDTKPTFNTMNSNEGSFLGDAFTEFMQGPAIPLGGFIGAGAFGAGGLGNFLGSFGQGVGGAIGSGATGGGMFFDPLADFGGSYFDGLSNYIGGGDAMIPSSYGASGYPSTGVFSNGPTSVNPLGYLQNTPVTWDGGASGVTSIPGVLGGTNGGGLLNNLLGGGQGFSGLGAGLGALLGALGANQKPAGTTTSVQDIPDYLKGYQAMNLASGVNNFTNAQSGAALLPGSQQYMANQIAGKYLDPNTNPAFQPYVKDLMGRAGANFASLYGKSPDNLNNSAFQENYTRAITNAALPLYNQAFQTAQGNQFNAAANAPQYAGNVANAALSPNLAFKNLYSGARANTQPYFTSPLGGALSGALAGGMFGNSLFGSR